MKRAEDPVDTTCMAVAVAASNSCGPRRSSCLDAASPPDRDTMTIAACAEVLLQAPARLVLVAGIAVLLLGAWGTSKSFATQSFDQQLISLYQRTPRWTTKLKTSRSRENSRVRIALLSDAHLLGPQYKCCSESNAVDNESIILTNQHLNATIHTLNGLHSELRPKAAVFLGDVVHQGYHSKHLSWYLTTDNAYPIAKQLLEQLKMPLFLLWGNHDYKVVCGDDERSYTRQLSHQLFRFFFDSPPYRAVHISGWNLILLNSMLGPSWTVDDPRCHTQHSSFGAQQLAWLRLQLRLGMPSIVFMHHPLPVAAQEPGEDGALTNVAEVLAQYSNVRQVYTGHFHKGVDWGRGVYPFAVQTLPAVRYDIDNFFLLELEAGGSAHRLLDWDKNKGGARCSNTWDYSTAPPVPTAAPETGVCGQPLAEDTHTFVLQPIHHPQDYPAGFNPDASCAQHFLPAVLAACLEGDSRDCCQVLQSAFRPGSAMLFASCLCQPSFFGHASQILQQRGMDLPRTIERCIATSDADLQYLGTGACRPLLDQHQPPSSLSVSV